MMDNGKVILKETNNMQPKESKTSWHFYISLVKSGFRFGAGFSFIFGSIPAAGALLILAEVLGIAEEV